MVFVFLYLLFMVPKSTELVHRAPAEVSCMDHVVSPLTCLVLFLLPNMRTIEYPFMIKAVSSCIGLGPKVLPMESSLHLVA